MNANFFESFSTPVKLPLKSIESFAAIQARAFKRLTDIQVSVANLGIEGNLEQTRLLAGTQDYAGLVAAQSAFAGTLGNRWLNLSRAAVEVVTQTRDEMSAWMQQSLSVAQLDTKRAEKAEKPRSSAKPVRRAAGKKAA